MARVLVLDPDRDVRASLRAALETEGHRVLTAVNMPHGLALLATSAKPLVVLCSNDDPANRSLATFFTAVAADTRMASRHRYICLTTTPDAISGDLRTTLQRLQAPIVGKPFTLDELLGTVEHVASPASCLRPGAPPVE